MQTYKILSVLLDYPDATLMEHLAEMDEAVGRTRNVTERAALQHFLAYLRMTPLTEVQAEYVQTFDLTAEHSLHLTHHLFGDDKNRGPALIDLGELYKEYGVEVAGNELPDYLPLVLEFVAGLDEQEATVFLSDGHKVLSVLTDNLRKANSRYAALTELLVARASLTQLNLQGEQHELA